MAGGRWPRRLFTGRRVAATCRWPPPDSAERWRPLATGLEVFEQSAGEDVERRGDIEEPFVEQAALAEFDLDEHVPSQPGGKRDLFLRQVSLQSKSADACADGLACRLPPSRTMGVLLAGACRHATQSGWLEPKSRYNSTVWRRLEAEGLGLQLDVGCR